MQAYKLELGGGGGGSVGGWWSCRPSGSCQELSEDGIQSRWPGEALGLPAVASLTPAETIHLVWRGPPLRVEADRNLSGPGKGQECTSVCTGHAPPAHYDMGAREKAHTAPAGPAPPRHLQGAFALQHRGCFQAVSGPICPHESLACRRIQETEVTCSRKAAQTQINKLAVTLAFTHTNALSLASSLPFFFEILFSLYTYASLGECIKKKKKSPLLAAKLESAVSCLSHSDAEGCWIYSSLLGFGGIFTAVTLI